MAKTYHKNIRRTLLHTKSRFLAIFSIVALGVGFLAGLMASSPDIEASMETYLDAGNLYDFRVVSTLGLTDDDLDAVRALSGVEEVRGAYSADLIVKAEEGDSFVARAHSLPTDADGDPEGDAINRLTLTEGRWPSAPGECVVEEGGSFSGRAFTVGQSFSCTAENEDLDEKLEKTTYTIVGKVRDTYYFSYEREPASVGNGSVSMVFYLPEDAFAYSVYTELYGTVENARALASLGDEYETAVAAVTDQLEDISDARAEARFEEIRADAQKEIDDARSEYEDAKADAEEQLADAAEELADGRKQLEDGEKELEDGEAEYQDGLKTLEENEQALADGQAALNDALATLQSGLAEYSENEAKVAEGEGQLAEGRETLEKFQNQYEEGLAQWEEGRTQYEAGEAAYAEGLARYEAGKSQYEAGYAQYEAGETAYAEGLAQYEAGETAYADGLAQYEAGETAYAEGYAQYEAGETAYAGGLAQYNAGETAYQQLLALNGAQTAYETGLDALVQTGAAPDRAQAEQLVVAAAGALNALPQAQEAYGAAQSAYLAAYDAAVNAGADPLADPDTVAAQAARDAAWTAWRGLLTGLDAALDAVLPAAPGDAAAADDPNAQVLAAAGQAALQSEQSQNILALYGAKTALDEAVQGIMAAQSLTEEEARATFTAEALAALRTQLDESKETLAASRTQLDESKETLAASRTQLDESKKTLAASRTQLDAAKEELAENRTLLDETKETLAASKAELDAAGEQLAASRTQLDEAKAAIDENGATLENARAELERGWAAYNANAATLADARSQLRDAKRQLDDGFAQLTDKQSELADAQRQLAEGRETLADARQTLADARVTLEENRQKLLDGETDYETAKADADRELADAAEKLDDAQAELDGLEAGQWYVWDRSNSVSVSSFRSNVNKVDAVARVFPVFFFLVAALVVLTTMTRMVEEERLQIGTMKALGYSKNSIMSKYLIYSMAAAVSGALVGLALGFSVLPSVIWNAYAMMYYMPEFLAPWHLDYALLSGGSLVACALIATLSASRATLRETPAALMRPRAPAAGKRIFLERLPFLWRHLSFTKKVTARNLLRYKKRFWMTVIGVAGCTALLVTGFGLSDSISGIITKQYSDVYLYDLMTTVSKPENASSGDAYDYLFGDASGGVVTESIATCIEKVNETTPGGATVEVYLMMPRELDRLPDLIDLHERASRRTLTLDDTGVILTEKLAETMNARQGSVITLQNADGAEAQFTVTGVCEHYVSNYVYITPALYENAFGAEPEWNAVLSLTPDADQAACDAVSADLLAMDTVSSVTFTADTTQSVLNTLSAIDAVVVVVVVCAAMLALVVLYNLTNINIAERVKEIATIKVLGFYDKEVNAYVMRENVALSLIGAILGLFLGILLHKFVIVTIEVDAVMFGRVIDFSSYVYAILLTMLFSMVVNFGMGFKLKHISMVESMKAPE